MKDKIPPSVGCFRENYLYGCNEEGLVMVKFVLFVIYPTDDGDNILSVEENSARVQLWRFNAPCWGPISKICFAHLGDIPS